MNRILRVFLATDMRNQHDGLIGIAKREGIDLKKLAAGEHIVFTNAAMNKIKLYSNSGVLSYVRAESGKLNMGIIEQIPACFDARSGVDWNKAAKLALEKQLRRD